MCALQAQMQLVERLHQERVSQRGIARIAGVSRPTIIAWLRKKVFCPIGETLTPMMGRPENEIDEQWSYVGKRQQQVKLGRTGTPARPETEVLEISREAQP